LNRVDSIEGDVRTSELKWKILACSGTHKKVNKFYAEEYSSYKPNILTPKYSDLGFKSVNKINFGLGREKNSSFPNSTV